MGLSIGFPANGWACRYRRWRISDVQLRERDRVDTSHVCIPDTRSLHRPCNGRGSIQRVSAVVSVEQDATLGRAISDFFSIHGWTQPRRFVAYVFRLQCVLGLGYDPNWITQDGHLDTCLEQPFLYNCGIRRLGDSGLSGGITMQCC